MRSGLAALRGPGQICSFLTKLSTQTYSIKDGGEYEVSMSDHLLPVPSPLWLFSHAIIHHPKTQLLTSLLLLLGVYQLLLTALHFKAKGYWIPRVK
jgi:hypothetical protein